MNRPPKWQHLPSSSLESIYNPRAVGPNVKTSMTRRLTESQAALQHLAENYRPAAEHRYGSGAKETMDLYQPQHHTDEAAPLAIFIHGGYWRGGDKHECALIVPPLLDSGAVVANVNYDLCPEISLDTMVEQIVAAVRYCHEHAREWTANPSRIVLIGHSAGAHLAARVMNSTSDSRDLPADLIHRVVAISGVYEPEVITHISVNNEAKIDLETAQRNNCLLRPPQGSAKFTVIAGGDEPAGWIEQSMLYVDVVKTSDFDCEFYLVEDTDHFTVLCESFAPGSDAYKKIATLLHS